MHTTRVCFPHTVRPCLERRCTAHPILTTLRPRVTHTCKPGPQEHECRALDWSISAIQLCYSKNKKARVSPKTAHCSGVFTARRNAVAIGADAGTRKVYVIAELSRTVFGGADSGLATTTKSDPCPRSERICVRAFLINSLNASPRCAVGLVMPLCLELLATAAGSLGSFPTVATPDETPVGSLTERSLSTWAVVRVGPELVAQPPGAVAMPAAILASRPRRTNLSMEPRPPAAEARAFKLPRRRLPGGRLDDHSTWGFCEPSQAHQTESATATSGRVSQTIVLRNPSFRVGRPCRANRRWDPTTGGSQRTCIVNISRI